MRFNPDQHLKLVADDWQTLRPCDLFRLFESVWDVKVWPALRRRLAEKRPDLLARADDCLAELAEEHAA